MPKTITKSIKKVTPIVKKKPKAYQYKYPKNQPKP